MLSNRDRLAARQGQSGTPRHEYLQQLVNEYTRSPDRLRREEIVANLANFAYDPINYAVLNRLHVMKLFVEIISADGNDHEKDTSNTHLSGQREHRRRDENANDVRSKRLLMECAMGGICNCIPDPSLQISFIESDGVAIVLKQVKAIPMDLVEGMTRETLSDEDRREHERQRSVFNTALSALTITYFLLDSPAFASVSSNTMMNHVQRLCDHPNIRMANVAKAFVSRYEELLASVTT